MSVLRNSRKKRSRNGRQQLRTRRFIRAESLETRIVLDGSGLGIISPDFIPSIPISDDTLEWNRAIEVRRDNALLQFDASIDANSKPAWTLDFSYLFREDAYDNRASDRDTSSSPMDLEFQGGGLRLQNPGHVDLTGDPNTRDEVESPAETFANGSRNDIIVTLPAHGPEPMDVRRVEQDHLGVLAVASEEANGEVGVVLLDLGTGLAQRVASDTIADPGVISLPEPETGFLPVESSPVAPDAGSIASADSPGSEDASQRRDSAQLAATGRSAKPSEADREVALTRDQYFARHQARNTVAWSAQSTASEVRRHVDGQPNHESYTSDPTPVVRAASLLSPAAFGFAASRSNASGAVLHHTTRGAPWLGSASPTSHVVIAESPRAADTPTAVGPDHGQFVSESLGSGEQNRAVDLLIAQYEPLSILVGVSIVSAHVIADSRLSDKKTGIRAFRRLR